MQNAKGKITAYLISIPIAVSCVLRFFQLLRYTDKSTGLLTGEKNEFSIIIYAMLLAVMVIDAVYCAKKTELCLLPDAKNVSKTKYFASLFLVIAFFVDFIHQAYNCYDYLSRGSYVDNTYIILLIISALLALLCCFYFSIFALTVNGSNYDYRNFTLLHFVPAMWGFARLVLIMVKIIDIRLGIDTMLEFLLLCALLMFFFCFISMVDNNGKGSRLFVFFAIASLSASLILVLPRFAMLLSGRAELLHNVNYTGVTYVACGIFAVSFLLKNKNTN